MKKILVPLTGRPLDRRAVASAFLVAVRFGAHVQGFGVMPRAEISTSVEGAAIPSALVRELVRVAEAGQAEVIDTARRLFEEFRDRHGAKATSGGRPAGDGPSASWEQATGPLAETVAQEARLADLAVIAQPSDGSSAMSTVIEAALFGSGRPLLLAPLAEPSTIGDAIAVAWDGGAAAARAVAACLPFLHAVGRAVILSAEVREPGRTADPARLVEYLALHGIDASVRKVDASGGSVSAALLDAAGSAKCDLLVMGAYGHSRVREMVWGGVTLDVLGKPQPLPILMAH